jgi:hypothetical protein
MPQRIQRKRVGGSRMPKGAVYVGRGSKWGNRFKIEQTGPSSWRCVDLQTDEVAMTANTKRAAASASVALFSEYFDGDASELAGKDLACWCPLDQPCHADVLIRLANS